MFIRVKDPSTGHEFDVPEDSALLRRGLVVAVKSDRYPPSRFPRLGKNRIKLAGQTPSRKKPRTAAATTPAEEN